MLEDWQRAICDRDLNTYGLALSNLTIEQIRSQPTPEPAEARLNARCVEELRRVYSSDELRRRIRWTEECIKRGRGVPLAEIN
jgi:hypothetical protein